MNDADHEAAIAKFLVGERWLYWNGVDMLAAEALWGAAQQAIDAVSHARGQRHGNTRAKAALVQAMDTKYGPVPELATGFESIRDRLHNHFYTGRLAEPELSERLQAARIFIRQMQDIARQERGVI